MNRVKGAGLTAFAKAKELEQKHQITDKVGSALSSGLERLTTKLGGAPQAPAPPQPQGLPGVPR